MKPPPDQLPLKPEKGLCRASLGTEECRRAATNMASVVVLVNISSSIQDG
jgi:hypothetical protein